MVLPFLLWAVLLFPWRLRVLYWATASVVATALVTFPLEKGFAVSIGVPIFLGVQAAVRGLHGGATEITAPRTAFSVACLGPLVGADLLALLRFPAEGVAVIGGAGMADGVVVAPLAAMACVGLWRALGKDAPVEHGRGRDGWLHEVDRWVQGRLGLASVAQWRALARSGWAVCAPVAVLPWVVT